MSLSSEGQTEAEVYSLLAFVPGQLGVELTSLWPGITYKLYMIVSRAAAAAMSAKKEYKKPNLIFPTASPGRVGWCKVRQILCSSQTSCL
jgi:hypothetical protein